MTFLLSVNRNSVEEKQLMYKENSPSCCLKKGSFEKFPKISTKIADKNSAIAFLLRILGNFTEYYISSNKYCVSGKCPLISNAALTLRSK